MISAPVRVISASDGVAQVEPTAQSGCGGCTSRSSCGVSGLGKYFSNTRKPVEVRCDANVRAGDELQLRLNEGDLLKAGMMAYLLPSVLALIGAGVAAESGLGDVGAVLGAAGGFIAGFSFARMSSWTPQLTTLRNDDQSTEGETP